MQNEENKMFVGNLSFDIDQEALTQLFAEVDGVEVLEANLIMDRETNRPRGFGFVTVKTPEMAQIAITALNDTEVLGRKIVVNVAKPQEKRERPSGGYSNNRRY
jgi:RNA recognition motif-containing protein